MAQQQSVFREKSMERISSPEQLNDYLKVTKPAIWAVLLGIIIFLVGLIVWASFTYIGSFADGRAEVNDGVMHVYFNDEVIEDNVKEGMNVSTGGTTETITKVIYDSDGRVIAVADTTLDDGEYDATVNYKVTQLIKLMFGDERESQKR